MQKAAFNLYKSVNFRGPIHFVNQDETPSIYEFTLTAFKLGKPSLLHYKKFANQKEKDKARDETTEGLFPKPWDLQIQRDEYPYASTYEGGVGKALIQYVPASENRKQAKDLQALYASMSYEDGAAFLVLPVPSGNEPAPSPIIYMPPYPIQTIPRLRLIPVPVTTPGMLPSSLLPLYFFPKILFNLYHYGPEKKPDA